MLIYQMPCSTGTERSPNKEKMKWLPKLMQPYQTLTLVRNDYIQFLQHKRVKPKASRSLLIKMLLYNEQTKATRLLNHFRN